MSKKFAICGFMGSGKSTVFEVLKSKESLSKFNFKDLDSEILDLENEASIEGLVSRIGWDGFRALESRYISDWAIEDSNKILGLGGGALNEKIISLFKQRNIHLIWLKVPFHECLKRIKGTKASRPLLTEKSDEELNSLFEKRQKLYSLSDSVFENENIEETVGSLEELINNHSLGTKGHLNE